MAYADSLMDIAKKNTIAPTDVAFDESKGVAGRVSALTNSASPLMETARTKAKQYSASRGLLNSTLAGQAGEQAVIETATPIANADAGLYQQQSLTNQTARNNALTQNANNALTAGAQGSQMDVSQDQASKSLMEQARQFGVTSGQNQQQIDARNTQFDKTLTEQGRQFDTTRTDNASMFDRELGEKARQFGLTQNQQMGLAQMDVDSKAALAKTERDYKTEIQSSANIANAWGTLMQGIAAIQTDPTLDGDTKKTLIENNLGSSARTANSGKRLRAARLMCPICSSSTWSGRPRPERRRRLPARTPTTHRRTRRATRGRTTHAPRSPSRRLAETRCMGAAGAVIADACSTACRCRVQ